MATALLLASDRSFAGRVPSAGGAAGTRKCRLTGVAVVRGLGRAAFRRTTRRGGLEFASPGGVGAVVPPPDYSPKQGPDCRRGGVKWRAAGVSRLLESPTAG